MKHLVDRKETVMATLPRVYKIVVFGEGEVGKTEDAFQAQAVIDGEVGVLDILDTAGQEGLQTSMRDQYMRHGEGYIGVYSITSASSFERLRQHLVALHRVRGCDRLPLVIVGNKLDLFNQRQVATVDGVALAREFDCPFYEASAANRINVEDVFIGLVRQVRKFERGIDDDFETKKKPKLKRLKKFVVKKLGAL